MPAFGSSFSSVRELLDRELPQRAQRFERSDELDFFLIPREKMYLHFTPSGPTLELSGPFVGLVTSDLLWLKAMKEQLDCETCGRLFSDMSRDEAVTSANTDELWQYMRDKMCVKNLTMFTFPDSWKAFYPEGI